jgi:hypothetical protein
MHTRPCNFKLLLLTHTFQSLLLMLFFFATLHVMFTVWDQDIPQMINGIASRLTQRENSTEQNDGNLESPILRIKIPRTPLNRGSPFGAESPLGRHLGEHLKRREFKHVALSRIDVNDVDAEDAAILLKPFWSNISASWVDWRKDADVGIILEHRVVVTATGRGRKNVVSVRKIWPWSPAFSSGTITVNDILVSVEGQPVEQMGLADVRALLRGEEGSTVIVEMLKHVAGNAPGRVSVHSE